MTGIIDTISVTGKVVLITGAGQGIGRTYAREFARAGAHVAVADINTAGASAVAAEIAAEGGRAVAVTVDVGAPESVRAALASVEATLGPVNVLINNAALYTTLARQPFDEIPFDEWQRVLHVNVTGSWLCAAAVAPAMRRAGWGRIIHISSSTVPLGLPMMNHYVTSKAAIIGMTRAMATELGPHGVTVNCILPGLTETEVPNPGRSDAVRKKVVEMQCIKRLEVPDDLAGMLLFLASPASNFITGQSLAVEGGSAFL